MNFNEVAKTGLSLSVARSIVIFVSCCRASSSEQVQLVQQFTVPSCRHRLHPHPCPCPALAPAEQIVASAGQGGQAVKDSLHYNSQHILPSATLCRGHAAGQCCHLHRRHWHTQMPFPIAEHKQVLSLKQDYLKG